MTGGKGRPLRRPFILRSDQPSPLDIVPQRRRSRLEMQASSKQTPDTSYLFGDDGNDTLYG
jgi:hypothetical protein